MTIFTITLPGVALTSAFVAFTHRETGLEVADIVEVGEDLGGKLTEEVTLRKFQAKVFRVCADMADLGDLPATASFIEFLNQEEPFTSPITNPMSATEVHQLIGTVGVEALNSTTFILCGDAAVMIPAPTVTDTDAKEDHLKLVTEDDG